MPRALYPNLSTGKGSSSTPLRKDLQHVHRFEREYCLGTDEQIDDFSQSAEGRIQPRSKAFSLPSVMHPRHNDARGSHERRKYETGIDMRTIKSTKGNTRTAQREKKKKTINHEDATANKSKIVLIYA